MMLRQVLGVDGAIFLRELLKYFGLRKTTEILGHCLLWTALGVQPAELDSDEVKSYRFTWWRRRQELKKFAEHMRELGYWEEVPAADELMRGIASLEL